MQQVQPARQVASAAVFGGATAAAAWIASLATSGVSDSEWFRSLEKLAFYPPDAAFSIVWATYLFVPYLAWIIFAAVLNASTVALN